MNQTMAISLKKNDRSSKVTLAMELIEENGSDLQISGFERSNKKKNKNKNGNEDLMEGKCMKR